MTTENLIKHLNRLRVQTGSLACLGCKHEDACGVHGCAIMREAAPRRGDERNLLRQAAHHHHLGR